MAKIRNKENKNKDTGEIVIQLTNDLLNLMGVKADVNVTENENDIVSVEIDSAEEKGLLIGRKGETLFSLQHILTLMLFQKLGTWKRVQVDVGGWRKKQEEYLIDLAHKAEERVMETKEEQRLYNLNPSQRRIVHMEIAKNKKLISESEGEGSERCLVIRMK